MTHCPDCKRELAPELGLTTYCYHPYGKYHVFYVIGSIFVYSEQVEVLRTSSWVCLSEERIERLCLLK